MEIERKFLLWQLPEKLEDCPHTSIEQAYLCTQPVVRVRRKGAEFWLTCKGEGLMARAEYELPLSEQAYLHLLSKADGRRIQKERYRVPWGERTVEVDVFQGDLAPLVMAEVEFSSVEEAEAFQPPAWFGREVTYDPAYTNAHFSQIP
ncbi:MAG: CYTH domain-containing protein [Oscillospiraceae bacterium]|nr:CYTH domain-containing protein [Oscillospiraceae bacterium]